MATQPRVLASTTSHKREALLPTLEAFGKLGLSDIDLNLHHLIELGTPVHEIARAVHVNGLRLWGLAGGWCDFFHRPPRIDDTFASVSRQVGIARELAVTQIRLFFGRLHYEDYSREAFETVTGNLSRLSDAHPAVTFVFENHDGASLHPEVCAEILQRVARPNIRMNFDPINFARAGVDPAAALRIVQPLVGHVHLKGLEAGEFCEFGEGDVPLGAVLSTLEDGGYEGRFSVEYEGPFDGTLRLYRSVQRARALLEQGS